ncbi:MAG: hypothetical protein ACFCD0_10350 [Gemmataceae bacterium]
MKMEFPQGFMGFWYVGEEPVSRIDVSEFRALCYAVARQLGGTVSGFRFASTLGNFHSATLHWDYDRKTADILCNCHHWIIAFAKPRSDRDWFLEFLDYPEIAVLVRSMWKYRVLTKMELETLITDDHLDAMAPTDRKMIAKGKRAGLLGKPLTIGDVVFHFLD